MLKDVLDGNSKIDIIIGIPSFNEEDNIDFVAEQVDMGLQKYYPEKKALIVNCDGGSTDNTRKVFLNSHTKTEKRFIQTPKGVTGKGNSFKLLFKIVETVRADSVMVVDADLKSINDEWVNFLLEPVFQGYDYITPVYARHKYDGTITNMICFPLIYGLLGKNIRQPIGGDFAFSGKLGSYWLSQQWYPTTGMYGIDIFMTTHAIFGCFRIAQTGLGAKIHKPSAPKLSAMFTQVVSTLFENILRNKIAWINKNRIEKTELFGLHKMDPAQDLIIDNDKILELALSQYDEDLLKQIMSEETFEHIQEMFIAKKIHIDVELWCRCVYDIIYAFSKTEKKEEIVNALKSLYFARIFSFINETKNMSNENAEDLIKKQAKLFWDRRDYLVKKLL